MMPRTIVVFKRIVFMLLFSLFLWLVFISVRSESGDEKKYKAKHDYSNIYKNKLSKVESPIDGKDKKAFMFRNSDDRKNVREDLKPKLVYRGTDEEIDPNDIGLVKNAEDKRILDEGYKHFAYNSLVSQRLGLFRDINDTRHKHCRDKTFPSDLPTASVIICFYNEEFYTLMRSVFSVIRRSPSELVKEVILVNDNSEDGSIVAKIDNEIKNTPELSKVRLFTPDERLGLIR